MGFLIHELCQSSRNFWSVSARGWVIDEDAHLVAGRRRESLFTGALQAISKLSAPVAGVVVGGQAWAGIDTTQDSSYEQPASGVIYIRSVYMYFLPALCLAQAAVIWRFPIRGTRLEALERKQEKNFHKVTRQ